MVLRRCRKLLHDEQQAADAMQDTFVKLIRYKEKLEDQAPSSLLYTMATNICLNQIRSKKRRPESPAEDDLLYRIAKSEESEPMLFARGVLSKLFASEKASTQTIAVLHLLDGLTLEETATQVGLSVSGVRKRLRGLRGRLMELEGASL